MTQLTNEDKVAIINSHKRSVEYSKYNLELLILEENAITSPDQTSLDSYNAQIIELENKLAVLDAEIASL